MMPYIDVKSGYWLAELSEKTSIKIIMRIEWDDVALQDRERIFEFLYPLNPLAEQQVDDEIELTVELLLENQEMARPWYGGSQALLAPNLSIIKTYN
jgi:hypothetical protein